MTLAIDAEKRRFAHEAAKEMDFITFASGSGVRGFFAPGWHDASRHNGGLHRYLHRENACVLWGLSRSDGADLQCGRHHRGDFGGSKPKTKTTEKETDK